MFCHFDFFIPVIPGPETLTFPRKFSQLFTLCQHAGSPKSSLLAPIPND
jgi:hypothetical protein